MFELDTNVQKVRAICGVPGSQGRGLKDGTIQLSNPKSIMELGTDVLIITDSGNNRLVGINVAMGTF